jgi:hypothetical protein
VGLSLASSIFLFPGKVESAVLFQGTGSEVRFLFMYLCPLIRVAFGLVLLGFYPLFCAARHSAFAVLARLPCCFWTSWCLFLSFWHQGDTPPILIDRGFYHIAPFPSVGPVVTSLEGSLGPTVLSPPQVFSLGSDANYDPDTVCSARVRGFCSFCGARGLLCGPPAPRPPREGEVRVFFYRFYSYMDRVRFVVLAIFLFVNVNAEASLFALFDLILIPYATNSFFNFKVKKKDAFVFFISNKKVGRLYFPCKGTTV